MAAAGKENQDPLESYRMLLEFGEPGSDVYADADGNLRRTPPPAAAAAAAPGAPARRPPSPRTPVNMPPRALFS